MSVGLEFPLTQRAFDAGPLSSSPKEASVVEEVRVFRLEVGAGHMGFCRILQVQNGFLCPCASLSPCAVFPGKMSGHSCTGLGHVQSCSVVVSACPEFLTMAESHVLRWPCRA